MVEAAGVHLRPEQGNGTVRPFVCLEPLEDLLGIVEHQAGGIEDERAVRLDPGIEPPLVDLPLGHEHPVGEEPAETEPRLVGELGLPFLVG